MRYYIKRYYTICLTGNLISFGAMTFVVKTSYFAKNMYTEGSKSMRKVQFVIYNMRIVYLIQHKPLIIHDQNTKEMTTISLS